MKRILSFLLVFTMIFAVACPEMLPVKAEAIKGFTNSGVSWNFNDGVLTISGTGYMDDFAERYGEQKIPWSGLDIKKVIVKEGVKSIGNFAFCNDFKNIESVELPDSIERIGMYAFAECTSLENIEIPDNVNFIGESAFEKCPIDSVSLPEDLEFIAGNSFYGCSNLIDVIIPDSVIEIRAKAFFDCKKLKSVVFGRSLRRIGEEAFSGCTSLEAVSVNENLVAIIENAFQDCSSIKNVTYESDNSKAKEIFELHLLAKQTITYETNGQCGENAYWSLTDGVMTVTGTGKVSVDDGETVAYTRLDRAIIKNSNIKSLIVENGITELDEVFISGNKSLEVVVLPDTLKMLNIYSFQGCTNLRSVDFPDTEFEIDGGCFESCVNLKNVYIPEGAKLIGYSPFGNKDYLGKEKIDITFYTPENSNAYKWANANGFKVVASTREDYEKIVGTVNVDSPKPSFTPEKADKSAYVAPSFKDITKETDYTDYIIGLGYLNLFKGDEQGSFNPESTITRAEFAAIVCRMLGYEKEAEKHIGKSVFSDVPGSHWASGYIYVASELGIINGYGNGMFGPSDPVMYEQAIKMLVCALEYDIVSLCSAAGVSCINNVIPYPEGYMAIAKEYNMSDSVYKIGDYAPRKLMAKLIYLSLNRFTVFGYGDTISISGDPLLKKVFGIGSEEEFKKIIENTKAKILIGDSAQRKNDTSKNDVKDIPNDNVIDTEDDDVNDEGKDNSTFENNSNNGLADWINVDYASFKLQYGKARYAMNYEGPLYQFEENGAWFAFSDSEYFLSSADGTISSKDPKFVEPSPFSVCTSIYTTVNDWLGLPEKGITINSIEELEKYGPVKSYNKDFNYMYDTEYYFGKGKWYGVSVDYNSEGSIAGDSAVYISEQWKQVSIAGSGYYDRVPVASSENSDNLSGTVIIPEGTKRISVGKYKECKNITKVVLPKSLEEISEYAFENCTSLKEINIPTGVTYIGKGAFKNCTSLEFIKIPHSVKYAYRSFENCPSLKTVVLLPDIKRYTSSETGKVKVGCNELINPFYNVSQIENVVFAGECNFLSWGLFNSVGDEYTKNVYLLVKPLGANGYAYGSDILSPETIYYVGSGKELATQFKNMDSMLSPYHWEKEDIYSEYYNQFDFPYLDKCLEKEYNGIKVKVNGNLLIPDYPSYQKDGVVYVSAFDALEALGMSTDWDEITGKITATGKYENILEIQSSNNTFRYNDVLLSLNAYTTSVDGNFMIPIEDVVKHIGGTVQWNESENMLEILYQESIPLSYIDKVSHALLENSGVIKNIQVTRNANESLLEFDYYNYLHVPMQITVYDENGVAIDSNVTGAVWTKNGFVQEFKKTIQGGVYLYDILFSKKANNEDYIIPYSNYNLTSFSGEKALRIPHNGRIAITYPHEGTDAYYALNISLALRCISLIADTSEHFNVTEKDIKIDKILEKIDWTAFMKAMLQKDSTKILMKSLSNNILKNITDIHNVDNFRKVLDSIVTNADVSLLLKYAKECISIEDVAWGVVENIIEMTATEAANKLVPGSKFMKNYLNTSSNVSQMQLTFNQMNAINELSKNDILSAMSW